VYKQLLPGTFVYFYDLVPETTEEDLRILILNRTGVDLGLERICVKKNPYKSRAMISLSPEHICDFISWALSDDLLHGAPFVVDRSRRPV
jgi:hypothetical protein